MGIGRRLQCEDGACVPANSRSRLGAALGPAAALAATIVAMMPQALVAGSIRATLAGDETVRRVWAIQRQARHIRTSAGKTHDVGMYGEPHEGTVDGRTMSIANLPVPGRYDLKIETASGGVMAGWDASVPESEYVGDPPLEKEAKQKIFAKLADEQFSAFADRMWVLDVQGNLQHAALLVMKLRMRPFVGGAYKPGEWVFRIDRWHWENPDDQTWVPYQERPFYALVRERLYKKDYEAKRVAMARHLGGIALTEQRPEVNLGTVKVVTPEAGVLAVNADGSPVRPVVLKGPKDAVPSPAFHADREAGGQSEGG